MTNLLAGVFCTNKDRNANQLMDPIRSSIFFNDAESKLIADECLTILVSNKTITGKFKKNIFITYLGDITGYLVAIPSDYKDDNLDTLQYLYQQYGPGFAKHVNGHFVIIVWDKNTDQFYLIQDKFPGIKTCYWFYHQNCLFFSNYIKPLLVVRPEYRKELSDNGLYKFLRRAYISAPDTIFKEIWQIGAGELIRLEHGKLEKKVYDPWCFSSEKIKDKNEAVESYNEVLSASIQSYCMNHPPYGFFLSGGYDSSVNVALGSKSLPEPLVTLGIGSKKYNTDAPFAKKVSHICKTHHYEYIVDGPEINDLPQIIWQTENPFYDPGMILVNCLMKLASKYVKHTVGGDGNDQLFGARAPVAFSRYSMNKKSFGLFKFMTATMNSFFRHPLLESNTLLRKIENRLIGKYNVNNWIGGYGFRDCDLKYIMRKKFYFNEEIDCRSVPDNNLTEFFEFCCTDVLQPYVTNSLLFKCGRVSDLNGINHFTPYCDKNVFNFILSLDHSLRTPPIEGKPGEFEKKYLHKELANNLLPHDIFDRSKQGGAIHPIIHLEDANRLSAIKNVILKSDFISEHFKIDRIERLFDHGKGAAVQIMQMLTLALWHHIFIEKDPITYPSFTLDDYLASI